MKGIGHRIQKCREHMGLKQEELAEMVDLSCNYLGAIERDVKTPVFCQALFPEKSVKIPFFRTGNFPAFGETFSQAS